VTRALEPIACESGTRYRFRIGEGTRGPRRLAAKSTSRCGRGLKSCPCSTTKVKRGNPLQLPQRAHIPQGLSANTCPSFAVFLTVGYRCSAEPVTTYVSKGGKVENTAGRKCLCNALMANIGHPQTRNGKYVENGMVTSGNDLTGITRFLQPGATTYTAMDVVASLVSCVDSRARSGQEVSRPVTTPCSVRVT